MIGREIMVVVLTTTGLLYLYELLRAIGQRNRRVSLSCAVGLICSYGFMNWLKHDLPVEWVVAVMLLVLLILVATVMPRRIRNWEREHVNRASVKEAVDNLPVGICCYRPDGLVRLKNRTAETLCFALTGGALLSGAEFWQTLSGGTGDAQYLECGDSPVLRMKDGHVWSFVRTTLVLHENTRNKDILYEILASDRTEEYARNEELRQKRELVERQSARMRKLNQEIEHMVIEKEVLSAKVRIHDDLSRLLLTARQYLLHASRGEECRPGMSRRELTELWRNTLLLLRSEEHETWRDGYQYAFETAGEFGIQMTVKGTLPEQKEAKELLAQAMVTCLSNAFRHAGAGQMTVEVVREEGVITAEFTNDGEIPGQKITEKGGLVDLRKKTEQVGGTMEIRSTPAFGLRIMIPEGEK